MTINILFFKKNIYIPSLVAKLTREFEHISYKIYSKSKTTSKSSILDHTLICTIKPSYPSTRVFNLILTTLKHLQIL
jgi:hypothetical protein